MCNVPYCDKPAIIHEDKRKAKLCKYHYHIHLHAEKHDLCANRSTRPWLWYKLERMAAGLFVCENPDCISNGSCFLHKYKHMAKDIGWSKLVNFVSSLFDVDHIVSDLKHTSQGEHPDNYQMICSICHRLKTQAEEDSIAKVYR